MRAALKTTLERDFRNLEIRVLQQPVRAFHAQPLPILGGTEADVLVEPALELPATDLQSTRNARDMRGRRQVLLEHEHGLLDEAVVSAVGQRMLRLQRAWRKRLPFDHDAHGLDRARPVDLAPDDVRRKMHYARTARTG